MDGGPPALLRERSHSDEAGSNAMPYLHDRGRSIDRSSGGVGSYGSGAAAGGASAMGESVGPPRLSRERSSSESPPRHSSAPLGDRRLLEGSDYGRATRDAFGRATGSGGSRRAGGTSLEGIQVYVRVRPPSTSERRKAPEINEHIEYADATGGMDGLRLLDPRGESSKAGRHDFAFPRVYRPTDDQGGVFEDVGVRLVDAIMDGYSAACVAYGKTGSGKTYTMMGPGLPGRREGEETAGPDLYSFKRGLIPRIVESLYGSIAYAEERFEYTVQCSYVELYGGACYDLLGPRVRRGGGGDGRLPIKYMGQEVVVASTTVQCRTADEVMRCLVSGNRRRATAATDANERSSRSHALLRLHVEKKDTIRKNKTTALLQLVDLAGSESAEDTGTGADRQREARTINSSLAALGRVCSQLTNRKTRGKVPRHEYRNSALTMLLMNCLGGRARTSFIINVAPWTDIKGFTEALRSCRFGKNAASIVNKVKREVKKDYTATRLAVEEAKMIVAQQESQLRIYRKALRRMADRCEHLLANRATASKGGLLALQRRFPVIRALNLGAEMLRFTPRRILIRIASVGGGDVAAYLCSCSKGLRKAIQHEPLWRMLTERDVEPMEAMAGIDMKYDQKLKHRVLSGEFLKEVRDEEAEYRARAVTPPWGRGPRQARPVSPKPAKTDEEKGEEEEAAAGGDSSGSGSGYEAASAVGTTVGEDGVKVFEAFDVGAGGSGRSKTTATDSDGFRIVKSVSSLPQQLRAAKEYKYRLLFAMEQLGRDKKGGDFDKVIMTTVTFLPPPKAPKSGS